MFFGVRFDDTGASSGRKGSEPRMQKVLRNPGRGGLSAGARLGTLQKAGARGHKQGHGTRGEGRYSELVHGSEGWLRLKLPSA